MWQAIVPAAVSLLSSMSKKDDAAKPAAQQPTMPTAATISSDEAKRQWFTPAQQVQMPSVAPVMTASAPEQTAGIAGGVINAEYAAQQKADEQKKLAAAENAAIDTKTKDSLSALADAQQKRDAAMSSLISGSPTVGSLSMPVAATVGSRRNTNSFY